MTSSATPINRPSLLPYLGDDELGDRGVKEACRGGSVHAASLGPVLQKPNYGSEYGDVGVEAPVFAGEQGSDGICDALAVD